MIWRVCGAKSTKFSNGSSAPVLIEVSPIPRLCAGVVFAAGRQSSIARALIEMDEQTITLYWMEEGHVGNDTPRNNN